MPDSPYREHRNYHHKGQKAASTEPKLIKINKKNCKKFLMPIGGTNLTSINPHEKESKRGVSLRNNKLNSRPSNTKSKALLNMS